MSKNNPTWKDRYRAAYDEHQLREYPASSRDFGTLPPNYPKVATSNGLTRMITDFLKFKGHRATRINVGGRLIEKSTPGEAGGYFLDKKYITSSTRKGTADVSATINGRSVMIEVKIAPDKPREAQLLEQQRERRAGGIYEFVYTPEEFLTLYDRIISGNI